MEFKLKDLVNIKYGKNQKNVKNPRGEYPILGTGGIMDYADDFLYDKPSVLIGRKGSIGKVKYIEEPFWTIDTLFYTIVNENLVIPKYLYYKLSQIDFNYYNEGTTIPSLRTETLYKIDIDLPKKNIQKKVVNLLNTIDKKIENNQKIITNFEEISQTLFKRWFVDFEFPDENGNPYKSSGGEMVDSELGEIPERWEVVKLKDIVYQKKDTFNPKKSNELKVLHFSLPAFDSSQNPVIDDVNAIKSNKWIIDENCILFSKMNPSTRRIWLTSNDSKYLNVASSEFVVLKSDNSYKNAFIYNICTSDKFSEFLNSNTTGSTNSRQRVKPDIAISYKLAFHNETSMLFSNKVEPYLEKIKVIRNENQKLAELRDTLLPKLMSGEIEIPDDIEVNEDELSI
ncbi:MULTISPECIES: restriction endonuclease subunit S [Staphylococcus]|uniref:restriction endonuclease subunit S n=1 Tax=Staphylococcus TaxID=1279 RepID=UPI0018896695|nr:MULTISPECIES: restriction endonuclease subunit S [Staphylococcus]MBF2782762.1 restriction endonuclease subunit S [Staphylococcus saprophyticus]